MSHTNPMFHRKRRHQIATRETVEALVDDVKRFSWTLCTGFRWRSILLLNDSISEDSIQEYAVIRLTPNDTVPLSGRMIESLTVDWMTAEDLKAAIERYDREGSALFLGEYIEAPHPEGSCHACA